MPGAVADLGRARRRPGRGTGWPGSAKRRRRPAWPRYRPSDTETGAGSGVSTLHRALSDAVAEAGIKVVQRAGRRGRTTAGATSWRPTATGPATSSRPTACTRRCAGCWGWTVPSRGAAASGTACTSRSHRGATTSRCTGLRTTRRTSPRWPTTSSASRSLPPAVGDSTGTWKLPDACRSVAGRRTAATSPRPAAAEGARPDRRPGVVGRRRSGIRRRTDRRRIGHRVRRCRVARRVRRRRPGRRL